MAGLIATPIPTDLDGGHWGSGRATSLPARFPFGCPWDSHNSPWDLKQSCTTVALIPVCPSSHMEGLSLVCGGLLGSFQRPETAGWPVWGHSGRLSLLCNLAFSSLYVVTIPACHHQPSLLCLLSYNEVFLGWTWMVKAGLSGVGQISSLSKPATLVMILGR